MNTGLHIGYWGREGGGSLALRKNPVCNPGILHVYMPRDIHVHVYVIFPSYITKHLPEAADGGIRLPLALGVPL